MKTKRPKCPPKQWKEAMKYYTEIALKHKKGFQFCSVPIKTHNKIKIKLY